MTYDEIEQERTVAVLKGSFIAKHFPDTWYALKERELVQDNTDKQKLRDFLQAKIEKNEKRRRNK